MRVRRIQDTVDGPSYRLVDDDGQPIPVVSQFLRYLDARGCSPNTLSAYAYDLLHFTRFLHEQSWNYDDFTSRSGFHGSGRGRSARGRDLLHAR
jgi:hypothetical protein